MPGLAIFSGLPGTGKSTLASRLARELHQPLLRIDDLAVQVPADADVRFWDEKVLALLTLAETQLDLGLSVLVDSVFMGADRLHAQALARQYQAIFRPVYCFYSDEQLWERRVTQRFDERQSEALANWEHIQRQRLYFKPWEPGTALFVDAANPFDQNYAAVLAFVTNPDAALKPLPGSEHLVKGSYHERSG